MFTCALTHIEEGDILYFEVVKNIQKNCNFSFYGNLNAANLTYFVPMLLIIWMRSSIM